MSTDAARLQRALQLFDEALDQPVAIRLSWLAERCGDDIDLYADVVAMLDADQSTEGDPLTPRLAAACSGVVDATNAGVLDLAPGTRIGPWQVQSVLGRGGMGAVYRATRADGVYQSEAAIKRIRIGMDDVLSRQRFLRERQILARLRHPHIAPLLDGGVDEENSPYFAMALVEGERIDRWCDARALTVRERIRLLLQVLDAVAFAHRQLVVHRDLKPSNILVNEEGHAYLLDFGIAKLLEDDESGHTRTAERAFTPEYASPEQVHGEPVSTATDLYQLGVLLYALLAHAHPYGLTGDTPLRTRLVKMDGEPQPLWQAAAQADSAEAARRGVGSPEILARQLRGDLSAIARRCLVSEPGHRYGSVEALRIDLQAWLDGLPVSAREPSLHYRSGRFLRRHAWASGAAAFAVMALCVGLGLALWQANEARSQARRADVVNAYLLDIFRSMDPDDGLGADVTVRELIDQGLARLDGGELAAQPGAEGRLRMTLADAYVALGDHGLAEHQLQQTLVLLPVEQVDDILQVRYRQIELRLATGDLEGAEQGLDESEAWARCQLRRLSQPEAAMAGLGLQRAKLLAHQEQYEQSEKLAAEAWQAMRRALGDDDPQTRSIRVDYAEILAGLGRYDEALAHAQSVMEGIRDDAQTNEFRLATAMHNLAHYQLRAGHSRQSLETSRDALALRQRILPEGHPYLAISLAQQAMALENLGQNREALALREQVVEIYRTRPAGREYDLGREINNWGVACYELGDMACATGRIAEAIDIWSAVLASDHSSLLAARSNLAALYSRSGDLARGEQQLREVVAVLEATDSKAAGVAAVSALSSARNELTANLLAQHRNAEALALARLRWEDVQAGGDHDEDAIMALSMLALAELANGQPQAAGRHAETSLQRARAASPGSRREAFALMTLARAHLASGDAVQAAGLARQSQALFASVLGAEHRDTGLAHGVLGRALLADGQRDAGRREVDTAITILGKQGAWLPELAELRRLR